MGVSNGEDIGDLDQTGTGVHGIFQARVLEWVAIAFSKVFLNIFNFLLQKIDLCFTFTLKET